MKSSYKVVHKDAKRDKSRDKNINGVQIKKQVKIFIIILRKIKTGLKDN